MGDGEEDSGDGGEGDLVMVNGSDGDDGEGDGGDYRYKKHTRQKDEAAERILLNYWRNAVTYTSQRTPVTVPHIRHTPRQAANP